MKNIRIVALIVVLGIPFLGKSQKFSNKDEVPVTSGIISEISFTVVQAKFMKTISRDTNSIRLARRYLIFEDVLRYCSTYRVIDDFEFDVVLGRLMYVYESYKADELPIDYDEYFDYYHSPLFRYSVHWEFDYFEVLRMLLAFYEDLKIGLIEPEIISYRSSNSYSVIITEINTAIKFRVDYSWNMRKRTLEWVTDPQVITIKQFINRK